MVNWKKEGYQVGQKVFIRSFNGYANKEYPSKKGIVTYVGTKNLKVQMDEIVYTFNNRRISFNKYLSGQVYYAYKSKEEYEQIRLEEERSKELRSYIMDNLEKFSLKDLEYIKDFLEQILK